MSEHPILFSGEMVRVILEGRKTQTRRVLKGTYTDPGSGPYGCTGDRLWVKETFSYAPKGYVYRADFKDGHGQEVVDLATGDTVPLIWKPSIFMPRKASRITLEITRIGYDWLHNITQIDAAKEGVSIPVGKYPIKEDAQEYVYEFAELWDSINFKRGYGWETNPMVWVIEFRREFPR